jgi:uncharacterized membrane protein YdjX (TVP38/TMEM64 family)
MQKIVIVLIVAAAIAAFFYFDGGQYLSLEYFKSQREMIEQFQQRQPLLLGAIFFFAYIAVTALSLPGAAIMTLVAGALFGLAWGLLIVSFASTIGACLAFLLARSVLKDWVLARFSSYLEPINEGVRKEGEMYLFTLRLVPIFPFFVINLAMALTPIKLWSFYWVSQLGMLAGTAVFVNAGTQLAKLDSIASILSAPLIASFVLLGIFPWLAKFVLSRFQRSKA